MYMITTSSVTIGWEFGEPGHGEKSSALIVEEETPGVYSITNTRTWDAGPSDEQNVIDLAAAHGVTLTPELMKNAANYPRRDARRGPSGFLPGENRCACGAILPSFQVVCMRCIVVSHPWLDYR